MRALGWNEGGGGLLKRWRCVGTSACVPRSRAPGAWTRPPRLEEGPEDKGAFVTRGRERSRGAGGQGVQLGGPKPAGEHPLPPSVPGWGAQRRAGGQQVGLAGAPQAPGSYPTAPQAHVSSSASSPRALPPRGPGPSACGASGLTGAPSDPAFLRREDRAGSGRRPAGSTAPSALDGLRAAGTQAGPREANLGRGCGSAGLPRGRVARQLPSSARARDGAAFHRGHRYSGVTRPPGPRDGRRDRGRALSRSPGPCAPPRLLGGGPAHSAIAGGGGRPGAPRGRRSRPPGLPRPSPALALTPTPSCELCVAPSGSPAPVRIEPGARACSALDGASCVYSHGCMYSPVWAYSIYYLNN